MQTLGESLIRGSSARSYAVYIHIEFNGEFAITGSARHLAKFNSIARYWERAIEHNILVKKRKRRKLEDI